MKQQCAKYHFDLRSGQRHHNSVPMNTPFWKSVNNSAHQSSWASGATVGHGVYRPSDATQNSSKDLYPGSRSEFWPASPLRRQGAMETMAAKPGGMALNGLSEGSPRVRHPLSAAAPPSPRHHQHQHQQQQRLQQNHQQYQPVTLEMYTQLTGSGERSAHWHNAKEGKLRFSVSFVSSVCPCPVYLLSTH